MDPSRGVAVLFGCLEIDHLVLAQLSPVRHLVALPAHQTRNRPADIQYLLHFLAMSGPPRDGHDVGGERAVLVHHQVQVLILLLHLLNILIPTAAINKQNEASLGVVLVGEDESGEDAVVDGLDGLLFLAATVGIHAVVGFQYLQNLAFGVFAGGFGEQVGQSLQFLVVDVEQVLLLVESLGQH